jgi:hemerythrin-like domain-containing protein
MQPIAPLMIEHRLIERMIELMRRELQRLKDNVAVDPVFAFVDPVFIDSAVDFIRTYADRCHHGKEEEILFAALGQKELSGEHREMMADLVRDHLWGREATKALVQAKNDFLLEKEGGLEGIIEHLEQLVAFYPRHIEKEDKQFFIPCQSYFTDAEKADMLRAMWDFDRLMIHEKYRGVVEGMERRKACKV